jgi:serine/threonine protein kinase
MQLGNLAGQVLDDKYLIERELGRGGMGAVYKAIHVGTDRPVAVKVIVPQFMASDEFIERFRREAKAAGRLRHPNVVDVTDFGFATVGSNRIAYLVMEYLDGCTLSDILAEESMLPIPWVADILEQTCSAVDEAHKIGIVHRDLKPDNIWLEPNRRGSYTVKVLDFGLAKIEGSLARGEQQSPGAVRPPEAHSRSHVPVLLSTDAPHQDEGATLLQAPEPENEETTRILEGNAVAVGDAVAVADQDESGTLVMVDRDTGAGEVKTQLAAQQTVGNNPALRTVPADGLTRVGSILGTPTYMSPEQCRGEVLGARSDIYSLAVIAYQMVAGKPPFGGGMQETIRQHIESPPPKLKRADTRVPKIMRNAIMSGLAKNPDARPQSAAAFASAIRASLSGTGALLRESFTLYIQQFTKFFKVSLISHIPALVVAIALLAIELFKRHKGIQQKASDFVTVPLNLLLGVLAFAASIVVLGVTIRLVSQLFVAPLRPVLLGPGVAAVKKRMWPLVYTGIMYVVGSFLCVTPSVIPGIAFFYFYHWYAIGALGITLALIPGIVFYINRSLWDAVVMMEDLKGRKALRRSKVLVQRSRLTVIAIMLIQYVIPLMASAIIGTTLHTLFKGFNKEQAELVGDLASLFGRAVGVFIIPLSATLTALLYLKTRQAGGETLSEMLSQFESEDVPRTRWQMRMRERTSLPTPSGK